MENDTAVHEAAVGEGIRRGFAEKWVRKIVTRVEDYEPAAIDIAFLRDFKLRGTKSLQWNPQTTFGRQSGEPWVLSLFTGNEQHFES